MGIIDDSLGNGNKDDWEPAEISEPLGNVKRLKIGLKVYQRTYANSPKNNTTTSKIKRQHKPKSEFDLENILEESKDSKRKVKKNGS